MIKVREIISQLDEQTYTGIEELLLKNKADNFVLLLQLYRKGNISDRKIYAQLGISTNSFYVLKSRLYDKIQNYMSPNVFTSEENIIKQLLDVSQICFNSPREVAIAFLQKLETQLLHFDLHNELQIVYSALKKIHMHSDKYFYYSQLFNKHVALALSLEKAEESIGNFIRLLGQYDFSRSQQILESLEFIKKEVANIYTLNKSRQTKIIKYLIDIQLNIYCLENQAHENNTEELLQGTRRVFAELPEISSYKKLEIVLDYLCFEYYQATGQVKRALPFYEKINNELSTFLLFNSACLTSKFLISKLKFCFEQNRIDDLSADTSNILIDTYDTYTRTTLAIYRSMINYTFNNFSEAIGSLNHIINSVGFKDYFHGGLNVRLTLAYFYVVTEEYDIAENIFKSISRKIKSEQQAKYNHVLHLIKVFELEMKQDENSKKATKQRDLMTLFIANNHKGVELLAHLIPEFKRKYLR